MPKDRLPECHVTFRDIDGTIERTVYDSPEVKYIQINWEIDGKDGMYFYGTTDSLRDILFDANLLALTDYTDDDVPLLPMKTT